MNKAPNPLPRYYALLDAAHAASEAQDSFDLDSSCPASVAEWHNLCAENVAAQTKLLFYARGHAPTVIQALRQSAELLPVAAGTPRP